MEKNLKQLLLKDLCARLPYGVKIKYLYWDEDKGCEYPVPMILDDINSDGYIRFHGDIKEEEGRGYILTYLPYLRPMSSMTNDERKELSKILNYEFYVDDNFALVAEDDRHRIRLELCEGYVDWLNAHHIDYRGLIEKGLALEAPERIYKTE